MNETDDSPFYSFVLIISFYFFILLLFVCFFLCGFACFIFFISFWFFIGFVSFSLSLQSIFLCFPDEHRSLIALGRRTAQNRDSLVK